MWSGVSLLRMPGFSSEALHPIDSWCLPYSSWRRRCVDVISDHGSRRRLPNLLRGRSADCQFLYRVSEQKMRDFPRKCLISGSEMENRQGDSNAFLPIQTLKSFPIQLLLGKVVMVRLDCTLLPKEAPRIETAAENKAYFTIKYLCNTGAKVVIFSDSELFNVAAPLQVESVADHLSTFLQLKVVPVNDISCLQQPELEENKRMNIFLLVNTSNFKEEVSNCSTFAKKLASNIDIFVNDALSQSHKVLASTVGITRFCSNSIAGFKFEEELSLVTRITTTEKQPYVAVIGGSNLSKKSTALCRLASICDGLVFTGKIAFQIMHALGVLVPSGFLEHDAIGDAFKVINLAEKRNVPILFPNDFWCVNDILPELYDLIPSTGNLNGWTPVGLGPSSLNQISSFLSKSKKVLWIGPVEFSSSRPDLCGASKLVALLEKIAQNGCDVTVVGNAGRKAVIENASTLSSFNILESASVIWNFLNGRTLPGVAALDRAYPSELRWNSIFMNPSLPLTVDIGSGNGLFLLKMAARWRTSNFLGLEINSKLVTRCIDTVHQTGLMNCYFLKANATFALRSIISGYPGNLVLVSIQCPNPDFNKENCRWRMLQRALVEAIVDLLAINGKIFLQSDVEAVAVRMKELFMLHGRGKLVIDEGDGADGMGWLHENPFGIRSDWEQHALRRGEPMYRLMISKVDA